MCVWRVYGGVLACEDVLMLDGLDPVGRRAYIGHPPPLLFPGGVGPQLHGREQDPTVARGGSAPTLPLARLLPSPPYSRIPLHEEDNGRHLVEGGRRRRKDAETRRKPRPSPPPSPSLSFSLSLSLEERLRMTGQQRVSRPIIRPRAKSGEKDALPIVGGQTTA